MDARVDKGMLEAIILQPHLLNTLKYTPTHIKVWVLGSTNLWHLHTLVCVESTPLCVFGCVFERGPKIIMLEEIKLWVHGALGWHGFLWGNQPHPQSHYCTVLDLDWVGHSGQDFLLSWFLPLFKIISGVKYLMIPVGIFSSSLNK